MTSYSYMAVVVASDDHEAVSPACLSDSRDRAEWMARNAYVDQIMEQHGMSLKEAVAGALCDFEAGSLYFVTARTKADATVAAT